MLSEKQARNRSELFIPRFFRKQAHAGSLSECLDSKSNFFLLKNMLYLTQLIYQLNIIQ